MYKQYNNYYKQVYKQYPDSFLVISNKYIPIKSYNLCMNNMLNHQILYIKTLRNIVIIYQVLHIGVLTNNKLNIHINVCKNYTYYK